MLIVYLFFAIAVYVGLYFAMDFLSGNLATPTAWLISFNRMLVMPEMQVFQIARLLILLCAIYVVFDLIKTAGKKALKKKPPPEEMKLKSSVSEKNDQ